MVKFIGQMYICTIKMNGIFISRQRLYCSIAFVYLYVKIIFCRRRFKNQIRICFFVACLSVYEMVLDCLTLSE